MFYLCWFCPVCVESSRRWRGGSRNSRAGLLVQNGDAARVAAAAATGVGFLGAGVITTSNGIVSGLTTAASIWMAAASGVAAGAGLSLFVAMATGCAMVVLRMPRRAVGRRAARDFERDSIPPKDVEPDP